MPESFTETFAAGLASYGERPCIEFEGRWYSGDDITEYADAIASVLRDAGVTDFTLRKGRTGLTLRWVAHKPW